MRNLGGWRCDPIEQGTQFRNLQPQRAVGFHHASDALCELPPIVFPSQ